MWNKVLSVILLLAILGVSGAIGYVMAQPKVGETFTELYILGLEGKAVDYPRELMVSEEANVILGIANQEYETVSYLVEVRIDGVTNNEVGPVVLKDGEGWESEVSFVPSVAGKNQKVEFLLFKNGEGEVYLRAHVVVNVTGQ